jgi:hypothetical protein
MELDEYLADLIARLGPQVLPFGRTENPDKVYPEDERINFLQQTYDAINDGVPDPLLDLQMAEINTLPKDKMYIWLILIIDGTLIFRMIPDQHENPAGKNKIGGRANVCHSNISAGGHALQGGECWWCGETGCMYVNPKSGRYGAVTLVQWNAVLEFFGHVGYNKVEPILPPGWKFQS